MLKRRPLKGREGDAPVARPPTYVLHGGPARFALTGGALDVVGFWLGHVLDRARAGSPDQAAVAELERRIRAGLGVLRGLDGPARDAAEDGMVAALGLGFHHAGDPEVERSLEKKRQVESAKRARAGRAEKQLGREGSEAKIIIHRLCKELWSRDPDILYRHDWVQATIRKIVADVVEAMRPHIRAGSLWAKGCAELDQRMSNHVRTAPGRPLKRAK